MSKSHYIIPVFVPDLGCPHRCVFCNQKRITGINDLPSADEVRHKIETYLQTMPQKPEITKEVAFYGGSFTAVDPVLQETFLKEAYKFLADGKINGIRISTRPDAVSENIMAMLSKYGVDTVELGVQSMDDEVLWQSGRGHSSRDVLRASAIIKAWGKKLGHQVMVGLPESSESKEIHTALELISLQPDFVRIYPCLVLKDTPLAEMFSKGKYMPLTVEQAVARCKTLLLMFDKAGISVIRIGLQPSEQINLTNDVLAGPFHPAFRELVESAVAREMVEYLLRNRVNLKEAKRLEISVPITGVSTVRGHKGSNVNYFKKKYGITDYITNPEPGLTPGSIRLTGIDGYKCNYLIGKKDIPAVRISQN